VAAEASRSGAISFSMRSVIATRRSSEVGAEHTGFDDGALDSERSELTGAGFADARDRELGRRTEPESASRHALQLLSGIADEPSALPTTETAVRRTPDAGT